MVEGMVGRTLSVAVGFPWDQSRLVGDDKMANVAQLAKGVAKVALATVFTGPMAGARRRGSRQLEIASSRDGGSAEKRVLDRVAKEVEAVAAGQNIDLPDARQRPGNHGGHLPLPRPDPARN